MVNRIKEVDNELVTVTYRDLLDKILRVIRDNNLFRISDSSDRLLIDIDTIVNKVIELKPQNPLSSAQGVRSATINFTGDFKAIFPQQINQIRDELQKHLQTILLNKNISLQEFVDNLTTDLNQFQGNNKNLGFTYNFELPFQNLAKQKLIIDDTRPGSAALVKFHKITITVKNIDQFQDNLKQGLENYINSKPEIDNEEDKATFYDILDELEIDNWSDFHTLMGIVDTESLGKLKKEAKIRYLEYIRDNTETTDKPGFIYLCDLIRRLKKIEEYISDPNKSDNDYEVNYKGENLNYKDIFSRAESLDALPIIPIVTGNLGETTDKRQGEIQFVFGIKLKFGGPVQTENGQSVFEYNIDIINPESDLHKKEIADPVNKESFAKRVLRRVFLYFFIFACNKDSLSPEYHPSDDLNYDPIVEFQTKIMPKLQSDNDANKQQILRGMVKGFKTYNIQNKINILKKFLKEFLDRQTILPSKNYPLQIAIKKGILERDINLMFNKQFFNDVLKRNPKECLRYISIADAFVDENALCKLDGNIKIEDIRYFTTEESQQFSWQYDIEKIKALPIAWVPQTNPCWNYYLKNLQPYNLILFRYNNTFLNSNNVDPIHAFIYSFTWAVLSYMCLDIILKKAAKNLFIPMIRLHQGSDENPFPAEKILANLSKSLCHLFKEKYLANSQGFRVQKISTFTISNGLHSLYSILPKKFQIPNKQAEKVLDKLAIIIVSSLQTDAKISTKNRKKRISNLLGEIISITRQKDDIKLEVLQTFSDNYRNSRLYSDPPILVDTVYNLYQAGYRHFLYIAETPYSSTLHITQKDDNEGLYFMSPMLIKALKKNCQDIKIYPVFFDKYYVRIKSEQKGKSFYIQNTKELLKLSNDKKQEAVVFFNLFNGISVGKKEERFYNGVISYSTLLNIYQDILDDMDIRLALIDDNPLKNEILQYLTFFHFSRFEKNTAISLKLDPYENIMGDQSFGKLSIFPHIQQTVNFNSLAFLTEIKKILDA